MNKRPLTEGKIKSVMKQQKDSQKPQIKPNGPPPSSIPFVTTKFPATVGRIEQAKRFALTNFDKWNDITGFVPEHTSYYYELSAIIEDAVELGFGIAHGQNWKEIMKRIKKS